MKKISTERQAFLDLGLAELPDLPELQYPGRNGEELATDEAAVWKRVLNYRVAKYLQPARILETHGGLGIGTALYRHAAPEAESLALRNWQQEIEILQGKFDLIDIDPFGQPWDCLNAVRNFLSEDGVLMISNGEALAVWRNLRKQQRFPTQFSGIRMPYWVRHEYLPLLDTITKLRVQFFYAFPSSVRVILSSQDLPNELFAGCEQWMWWLKKYAKSE